MATAKRKKTAAKKKASSTSVVKPTKSGTVAEASMMGMYEQDSGAGLENIRKEDTKIPFLRILQALSPQLQDGDSAYIEGAKAGMLFNSVTHETYDGKAGILVIPVHFEKVYIEWKPRSEGGGFVQQFNTRDEADENADEANDIVDTAHHYCLVRSERDEVWQPIVIPCKSTMLSASRGWNAMMQNVIFKTTGGKVFTPPSFACVYGITTARQQNEEGTWYNIVVERSANVDDPTLYAMAKAFRHTLVEEGASLAYDSLSDDAEKTANAEDMPSF
jgi:hypothetical protein